MSRFVRAYRPLSQLSAAAAARRPALWRLLLGVLVLIAFYFAFLIGLGFFLRERYGTFLAVAITGAMLRGATPGAALFLCYSFAGLALAAVLAVRLVHGLSAATLFGPLACLRGDFWRAASAVLGIALLLLPIALALDDPDPGLPFLAFLAYLPAALLGILLQSSAEELVFRGYLLQQLAARFRSPLVWAFLPSALFGLGHYLPETYGPNAWAVVIWATLFGLAAADLTARTGALGAAIGLHFANNVAAFLFIGVAGEMDGLALWTRAVDIASPTQVAPLLLVDLATILAGWLAVRLALRV